jgi:hypothetical protein
MAADRRASSSAICFFGSGIRAGAYLPEDARQLSLTTNHGRPSPQALSLVIPFASAGLSYLHGNSTYLLGLSHLWTRPLFSLSPSTQLSFQDRPVALARDLFHLLN